MPRRQKSEQQRILHLEDQVSQLTSLVTALVTLIPPTALEAHPAVWSRCSRALKELRPSQEDAAQQPSPTPAEEEHYSQAPSSATPRPSVSPVGERPSQAAPATAQPPPTSPVEEAPQRVALPSPVKQTLHELQPTRDHPAPMDDVLLSGPGTSRD